MQRLLLIVASAVTFNLPLAGFAQTLDGVSARIVEYGIYYTRSDTTVAAPDTTTGKMTLLNEPVHVRTTDSIPGLTHSSFGLRYTIDGLPSGTALEVTDVITTPGLKNPNSDEPVIYRETHTDIARGDKTIFTGYTFNQPWEAVTGEWTIEVWHGNLQLLSKRFTVFPAKRLRN